MQGMSSIDETLHVHGDRALRTLAAYWHGLAAQDALPHWSAVDPAAIEDALEYAFLAERLGQSHARLRVAGGSVVQLFGQAATGRPLSGLLSPTARPAFDAAVRRCFVAGTPLALALGSSRRAVTGRMALYPLRGDRGRVTQLLGGLVVSGTPGPAPVRFDFINTEGRGVTGRFGACGARWIGALPQTPEFTGKMKGRPGPILRLVVNNG
jgi:hypothetical protein